MTRRRITLRNRAVSNAPGKRTSLLTTILTWLVDTDEKFRRTQALMHPPGKWP